MRMQPLPALKITRLLLGPHDRLLAGTPMDVTPTATQMTLMPTGWDEGFRTRLTPTIPLQRQTPVSPLVKAPATHMQGEHAEYHECHLPSELAFLSLALASNGAANVGAVTELTPKRLSVPTSPHRNATSSGKSFTAPV